MNNLAILPYITMHALQIQNVKRNTVKTVSIDELNNTTTQNMENINHLEENTLNNNNDNTNNLTTTNNNDNNDNTNNLTTTNTVSYTHLTLPTNREV